MPRDKVTVSLGYDRLTDDGEGKCVVQYVVTDKNYAKTKKTISNYK